MKKGLDVVISFDTTGSMYPVLTQVRNCLKTMIGELNSNIEDIRIGVIAHGDYCDAGDPYTIRILDFTSDIEKINEFIKNTKPTYGGDPDECYELVLNQVRTTLSWEAGREKVLILIGDADPHGVNYPQNVNKIDWKNETNLLKEAGVKIFSIQAYAYYRNKEFYKYIAETTGGKHLNLDQFSDVPKLITGICYKEFNEENLNEYVSIIRENGGLTRSLSKNFSELLGETLYSSGELVQKNGLVAVTPGRFQVMPINENVSIKVFIESNGITFKKGRTFYQMTKKEQIAQYKEIILQSKITGELFTGTQVREFLKLEPQIQKGGIKQILLPQDLDEYKIFIQSNSHNRKLPLGTCILYESEMI